MVPARAQPAVSSPCRRSWAKTRCVSTSAEADAPALADDAWWREVDGLLRRPPRDATALADLIRVWSPATVFEGEHNSEIDVTGGIGLKAARGAQVAAAGIEVMMVNGEHDDRVLCACAGRPTRGTRVVSTHTHVPSVADTMLPSQSAADAACP